MGKPRHSGGPTWKIFDIAPGKIAESAQRIVDRALDDARRQRHGVLGNEHLFVAFAQTEWELYSQVLRELDLHPQSILEAVETEMVRLPTGLAADFRVSPASKLVLKLAFHHATRAGRQALEAADLFAAIFEDSQGLPAVVMRRAGVEPETLVSRITSRVKEIEQETSG